MSVYKKQILFYEFCLFVTFVESVTNLSAELCCKLYVPIDESLVISFIVNTLLAAILKQLRKIRNYSILNHN